MITITSEDLVKEKGKKPMFIKRNIILVMILIKGELVTKMKKNQKIAK